MTKETEKQSLNNAEKLKMTKEQYEDYMRCARYLYVMIRKYGPKVLEDAKKEKMGEKK